MRHGFFFSMLLAAASVSTSLMATGTWPTGGTLTYTRTLKTGPNSQTDDFKPWHYYLYSNWTYTDSNGVHYFSGDTEAYVSGSPIVDIPTTLSSYVTDNTSGITYKLTVSDSDSGSVSLSAAGNLYPTFRILKLAYAPPGELSHMDYMTSSELSSTTSSSKTFETGIAVGFTSQWLGNGLEWTITASETSSSSDSLEIDKSTSWDYDYHGGPSSYYGNSNDGINHDNDKITLWLNPLVGITETSATNINTSYGVDVADNYVASGQMELYDITIGTIKTYLSDPNWVATGELARAWSVSGPITKAALQQILLADPYSNDPTGVNTSVNGLVASGRYTPIGANNITYEPSTTVNEEIYTQNYKEIATNTTSDEFEIKAEVKVTGGAAITSCLGTGGSVTPTFDWTHTNSQSHGQTTNDQFTVHIFTPSADYTGPQSIIMYQDNVFGSIAFVPAPIK